MMKSAEFIAEAIGIAKNYKTAYVWGTFGLVANANNMQRMINQYAKNTKYLTAAKKIYNRGFYFDCVGLIKGIAWGWNGNFKKTYGGATYASNGVPDVSANQMIGKCSKVSTDFKTIVPGEAVWIDGHIGIYVGDGKVVESTPSFNGGVQITACSNIKNITGLNSRRWVKHGRLPFIDYTTTVVPQPKTEEYAFTDIASHYAKNHIQKLYRLGVVSGYPNKSFKPGYLISRAEFGSMILNVLEKIQKYSLIRGDGYSDTKGHWAEDAIRKLSKCGIVNGFDDNTFRPDTSITRGQAAIMACNMLTYCGIKHKSGDDFPDTKNHYASKHIAMLKAYGVVNGVNDGLYEPDTPLKRGEAAVIIANCITVLGK